METVFKNHVSSPYFPLLNHRCFHLIGKHKFLLVILNNHEDSVLSKTDHTKTEIVVSLSGIRISIYIRSQEQ